MPQPYDFANANLDEIVEKLTNDEAISLTSGVGLYHTYAIERLGIPAIKVSDGPNGVRGNNLLMSTPSKCIPSATALAATWDTQLVEEVGLKLLAAEAKLKSASLILAPICNIQRNPLGGRSFECFSEDPILSGLITTAYVRGIQSGGIGTTIKHFVANEKEDDCNAYNVIVSPRALREIYLMPFMLAEKYAQPWSVMTAYNRVNGTHVSENSFLINEVLRNEWGFKGMVMSDWLGTYGVDQAYKAGLDLEMPGFHKWRTSDQVNRNINARKITTRDIRARARKVLELVQQCCKGAPEILDGDRDERTVEKEEDDILLRKVSADSIVLLKNEGNILPLNPQRLKKIAIVGGNAKAKVLSGGGSSNVKPSYFVYPYDGIVNALQGHDVQVTYSEGARTFKSLPTLEDQLVTPGGQRGWVGTYHVHDGDNLIPRTEPFVEPRIFDETQMLITTGAPKGIGRKWSMHLHGYLKPRPYDCTFEFGLMVAGRGKLYVDGNLVIDNWTRQRKGNFLFGHGTAEEKGTYQLKANTTHEIVLEFTNVRGPFDGATEDAVMDSHSGLRLGGAEVIDADATLAEAVQLAKEADVTIAIVGLNGDWEAGGYDRTTLALPGRADELVEKVLAVNPNTIVVTQSGSSITMPWVDRVPGLVHAWYLGNATGTAIADVLFGKHNPSGKLSLTFPRRLEDISAHGHFRSENGELRYGEDLFVGYKHFHHRNIKPLFPFGFGLSYTTFTLSDLKLSAPVVENNEFKLTASVTVTNTGSVAGSEVVQLYVAQPSTSELTHAPLQLRAFAKVHDLQPGISQRVQLPLDKYAVSYWEERFSTWAVEKGVYGVKVGSSSDALNLASTFEISKGFEWNGL